MWCSFLPSNFGAVNAGSVVQASEFYKTMLLVLLMTKQTDKQTSKKLRGP
jgi:hypothetical protein